MATGATIPLLQVEGLRVALPGPHGPLLALRGIDLAIDRGATVGVIGESGSGKSMMALAIMGLLPEGARVDGHIRLEGRELVGLDDRAYGALRGQRIAMIFQEPMTALNPLHTIGDQVAETLRVHRAISRSFPSPFTLHLRNVHDRSSWRGHCPSGKPSKPPKIGENTIPC